MQNSTKVNGEKYMKLPSIFESMSEKDKSRDSYGGLAYFFSLREASEEKCE